MENLEQFDFVTLVNMLSKYTNEYIRLFRGGASAKDSLACKNRMSQLTREIELRKQNESRFKDISSANSDL